MSAWFSADSPLISAHRGASADAPENTLTAFARAAEQQADGLELDVQLSADGHPIVMHDKTVDRTTNGSGSVSRLTVEQLQTLDGRDGRPVPTLDQVLEMFGPAMLYNIELKTGFWPDSSLAAAVAERIEGHQLEEYVIVSSFSILAVRQARRLLSSRTPVALLHMSRLSAHGHLLAGSQADHPYHRLVTQEYMAWAGRKKLRVNVWTVDEPAEAQRLANLGVQAIITNKPAFIRATL